VVERCDTDRLPTFKEKFFAVIFKKLVLQNQNKMFFFAPRFRKSASVLKKIQAEAN